MISVICEAPDDELIDVHNRLNTKVFGLSIDEAIFLAEIRVDRAPAPDARMFAQALPSLYSGAALMLSLSEERFHPAEVDALAVLFNTLRDLGRLYEQEFVSQFGRACPVGSRGQQTTRQSD